MWVFSRGEYLYQWIETLTSPKPEPSVLWGSGALMRTWFEHMSYSYCRGTLRRVQTQSDESGEVDGPHVTPKAVMAYRYALRTSRSPEYGCLSLGSLIMFRGTLPGYGSY